ncbi:hypothetical protein PR202_gb03770 [Eleusine coracana subsp. coracana]|uniref:Uncharacterized protein n=1 Tax=Eleusine coracana subsp. coracana TaxID=191504 RepID=A0AAV5E168_ELECO|nr:hypothetical protein PR202_gb03770 [Eleusine coracana subsp. coracana]
MSRAARAGGPAVDVEELLVRVKSGTETELIDVAREVAALVEEGRLGEDDDEGLLVPALLARLAGSGNAEVRVSVMAALRRLAGCVRGDSKERLASIEALSSIVRSLSRDTDERREAIAVLLDLTEIPQVRQRIGRIKGCIIMLVTLRNAHESGTNDDADKLLHILSSNPQNVLLMAEAGYFRPLIHYLKEGSDMNKVLMATAISKMFLSEQMKCSLGEDGAVEPLVDMFKHGNLEAKQSALDEKAAALGILSNLPVTDNKITEVLVKANLLHVLISLFEANITASLSPKRMWLLEGIAGVFIRFTTALDKKLQSLAVGYGVVPCLVKLLSEGSVDAKSKSATSLAQLSQSSMALRKSKLPRWLCVPPSAESYCIVHNCQCTVKSTFCLVKAGAVNPLVRILEGEERGADGAVLEAVATLMQDEIWENGSRVIERAGGIHALLRVAEAGELSSQDKAIWMLERIFRLEVHRDRYGEIAQALLIDLAQKGNPVLKPMIAATSLDHAEMLLEEDCCKAMIF